MAFAPEAGDGVIEGLVVEIEESFALGLFEDSRVCKKGFWCPFFILPYSLYAGSARRSPAGLPTDPDVPN
jgi:hypothetical protein